MKIYIFCNKVLFLHKDIHTFFVQEFRILEDVRESNDFYIPHQYWAVHYRTTYIQTLNSSRPLTATCTDTCKMYDLRRWQNFDMNDICNIICHLIFHADTSYFDWPNRPKWVVYKNITFQWGATQSLGGGCLNVTWHGINWYKDE